MGRCLSTHSAIGSTAHANVEVTEGRARHIKCSEERPECFKCVSHKFRCPGYTRRAWIFEPEKSVFPSSTAETGRNHHTDDNGIVPRNTVVSNLQEHFSAPAHNDSKSDRPPYLSQDAVPHSAETARQLAISIGKMSISKFLSPSNLSALTLRELQYFSINTIPGLLFVSPCPAAHYVFQHLLPQSFDSEPAIQHAVIATAAAQEVAFEDSNPSASLTAVSRKHYGKLLHILADAKAPPNTLIILTTCLLCAAYETMHNTPRNAALHVDNGLRVLREWKRVHSHSGQRCSPEDSIIKSYLEPVYAHLEVVFSRSSVSTVKMRGGLDYFPRVFPQRFQSLLQVRGKLLEIVMYFLNKHPPEFISAEEQLQITPMLQEWSAKLSIFMQELPPGPMQNQPLGRLIFALYQTLDIALRCQRLGTESVWDDHLDELQTVLSTCHYVAHHAETYRPSTKSSDDAGMLPGVLPPLWLIGMSCRNPLTRRQAIELLQHHHQRCGHADVCSAVVLAETVTHLEEEGIPLPQTCKDIPEHRRVRALTSDLTRAGKMVLTYTKSPYTVQNTIEVPYVSTSALPTQKYKLWPIMATMNYIGYYGLIKASANCCICKAYGV